MTKDNPVAAGVALDLIAETIWRSEWRRAGSGGERRVPWSEIAERDQERYRFLARDVAALFAASPVQAGIDPLVAETIAKLIDPSSHNFDSFDLHHEAAALLRSQAERISTLEVERDEHKRFRENCQQIADIWERRAKHFESLLAEAREALEEIDGCFQAAFAEGLAERLTECEDISAGSLHDLFQRRILFAQGVVAATLSRLKPGEKGGGE